MKKKDERTILSAAMTILGGRTSARKKRSSRRNAALRWERRDQLEKKTGQIQRSKKVIR